MFFIDLLAKFILATILAIFIHFILDFAGLVDFSSEARYEKVCFEAAQKQIKLESCNEKGGE